MLLSFPVEISTEIEAVFAQVDDIALQLQQYESLDDLLNVGVSQTRQLFGCDRALIYQFVGNRDGAVTAESVADGIMPILGQLVYDPCFETSWGVRFRQGELTAIANVEQADIDPCYVDLMQRLQVRANLVAPILMRPAGATESTLWGLLIIHQCLEPYSWRSLHRCVVRQLASALGQAIQTWQLQQQLAQTRQARSQWQDAIAAAGYGVWEWNLVTDQVFFSARWNALLGFAEDEFEHSVVAWDACLHPDDRDRVWTTMRQHWQRHTEAYRCEYRVRNRAGQWQWVLSHGNVIEWGIDRQPIRFIGMTIDISECKQLELEWQEQAQREQVLNQVVQSMRTSLELSEVFRVAATQISQQLVCRVRISHYVAQEQCWRAVAVELGPYDCSPEQQRAMWADAPDHDNPIAIQLKALQTIRVDDVRRAGWDHEFNQVAAAQFPGQWLIVPVANDGAIWGAVSLTRPQPGVWQASELDLIQRIAAQLAIAIEHASLHEQLRLAHSRDTLILSSISEGIWDWNPITGIMQTSSRYWEILGYAADHPLNTTFQAELQRVHPDDQSSLMVAVGMHLDTNERFDCELRLRHRQGHYLWLRMRGTAIWNERDRPIRMLTALENISDRKGIEAKLRQRETDFRSLVENNPDGILRVDTDFRIRYVNPIVESRLGRSRLELLGQRFEELGLSSAILLRWQTAIEDVFATGREQFLETVEDLFGQEHTFYSRLVPEYTTQGAIRSVLIISRDVSNLKAAQTALQRRADQERALRLITQHIRESLELETILTTTVNEVQRSLQADRTLIFQLHSDHSGQVIAEAVHPDWPVTLEMRWEDEYFSPACHEFYLRGRGRIVPDITQDEWGSCLVEFMQSVGVQSKMVAPILQHLATGPVLWGLLITHACATPRQWQTTELTMLQHVADQLAIAIQQSELHRQLQAANQELESLSNTDALTQIANRRYFNTILQQEWRHAQRRQRELTLILCDIDYFKQFNDIYGHPAGDDCLVAVAQALQSCISRNTDCIARYGGEEFAVILPHTPLAGAERIVQAMQVAIADLAIAHEGHIDAAIVTLSYGIAVIIPAVSTSLEHLLQSADRALYRAKQGGRNRYAIYDSTER